MEYAIKVAGEIRQSKPTDWNNTLNLALYNLASSNFEVSKSIYNDAIQQKISEKLTKGALVDLNHYLKLFPANAEAENAKKLLQGYLEKAEE